MTAMTDPGAASADGQALAYLRSADPVLARVIDAHAGFDPRGWLRELPAMDTFGALIFMVTGQQLSVRSAARILGRVQDLFGGRLPSPAALLAADPGELLKTGLSRRKVATRNCGGCPMRRYSTGLPPSPASGRGRCTAC
jgi:3-methyladenine DNA glycosylase/8-oxoguanine DNA glycosylase